MMMTKPHLLLLATTVGLCVSPRADAYVHQSLASNLSRRDFGGWIATAAIASASPPSPAFAFDGSGSSAYSGRSPSTKAAIRQAYQDRVAADVRDFNALGAALAKGETTESDVWVFFFNPYQRRNPDDVGRTYAALADFIGHKGDGRDLEGGDGYLLAATFTKQGKPPSSTPAVKSYSALSTAFEPIEKAGKKGEAAKARAAWEKAAALFSTYLEDVGMSAALDSY
mmetsp:Transcript_35169/g.105012  ORF Transcript_35169/g.105012 Transcript_35169/m.105012 type:complete len:226 (+) Transcript_35169:197-874(+)